MNSPELNNYIQYLTRNGLVKTKSVIFLENQTNITFQVKGIIEDFFILSVFQNNIKINGLGFDNVDNIDMLGFINSDIFDIDIIPQNSFFSSEQIIFLSYQKINLDTTNLPDIQHVVVDNTIFPVQVTNLPDIQHVHVDNIVFPVQVTNLPDIQHVHVDNTVFPVQVTNLPDIQHVVVDNTIFPVQVTNLPDIQHVVVDNTIFPVQVTNLPDNQIIKDFNDIILSIGTPFNYIKIKLGDLPYYIIEFCLHVFILDNIQFQSLRLNKFGTGFFSNTGISNKNMIVISDKDFQIYDWFTGDLIFAPKYTWVICKGFQAYYAPGNTYISGWQLD